jgi:hypothetical protein
MTAPTIGIFFRCFTVVLPILKGLRLFELAAFGSFSNTTPPAFSESARVARNNFGSILEGSGIYYSKNSAVSSTSCTDPCTARMV